MTEYYTERDIVDFAENWRSANGFAEGETLADEQIAKFVGELQERVARMDFSIPEGSVVIGYSGKSNGVDVWRIVQQAAHAEGSTGFYISDLPAGKLLNDGFRRDLRTAIEEIAGSKEAAERILGDGIRMLVLRGRVLSLLCCIVCCVAGSVAVCGRVE